MTIGGLRVSRLEAALLAIAWLSLAVLAVSSNAINEFMSNSDQTTIPSVVVDILAGKTFDLHTWMFSRAPYFFPDTLGFLGLQALVGDSEVAMRLYWVAHVLALGIAACVIGARAEKAGSAPTAPLWTALILCALVVLSGGGGAMDWRHSLWVLAPFAHASALLSGLLLYPFTNAVLRGRSVWGRFALFALCTLCVLSNALFIALFMLPYILSRLLVGLRAGGTWRRPVVEFAAIQLAAFVASRVIVGFLRIQQSPEINLSLTNMVKTAVDLYGVFVIDKLFLFWLPLLALFGEGLLALIRLKSSGDAEARTIENDRLTFLWFLLFCAGGGVAVTLLLSDGQTLGSLRYGVAFQFIGVCWLAVLLARAGAICMTALRRGAPARSSARIPAAWGGVLAAVCVVLTATAQARPGFSPALPQHEREEARALALQECKRAGGLKIGFAEYWTARRVWAESEWDLQVNSFAPASSDAFYWGGNLRWFLQDYKTGLPANYNFIIANDIAPEKLEAHYGKPTRVFDCAGLAFWMYDDQEALRAVALAGIVGDTFDTGMAGDRWLYLPASSFSNQIGARRDGTLQAQAGADKAGYLAFGPYMTLPGGSYDVRFEGACEGTDVGGVVDVAAGLGNTVLVYPRPFQCGGENIVRMDIPDTAKAIEFRLMFQGAGHLTFNGVSIRRVPAECHCAPTKSST